MLGVRLCLFSLSIYIYEYTRTCEQRHFPFFTHAKRSFMNEFLNILPSVHAVIFEVLGVVCNFLRLQVVQKVIHC